MMKVWHLTFILVHFIHYSSAQRTRHIVDEHEQCDETMAQYKEVGNNPMRFLFQCLHFVIINIPKQAVRVLCRSQTHPHNMQ